MQKLLITAVSELQTFGQAKWFDVTDGEGNEYLCSKLEQRTRFVIGQLNEVEVKVVEGKKKKRIELATITIETKPAITKEPSEESPASSSVTINTELLKLRSMLVSYAKDLAVADKIDVADIISHAEVWEGYILGMAKPPQAPPEAPQSKSEPIAETTNATGLADTRVEEAVAMGAELVAVFPSPESLQKFVEDWRKKEPGLLMGTLVARMESLQAGVTVKSKNKLGKATLLGAYNALTDDNKIKFAKEIGL